MAGDRYVVLGLARPRAPWFRLVAQWSTSAALPVEFLKCVSAEELRARLVSGRVFSAALLDAGLPAVDRDLLDAARTVGCAPVVVGDGRGGDEAVRRWTDLGAAALLPAAFTREHLLDVLAGTATMVNPGLAAAYAPLALPADATWQAPVAVVCGGGGTGASTVAIALAQGLATPAFAARLGLDGPVLLADLCRRGDQGLLHDAGDVFPGVQELVEAHRGARPAPDDVRGLAFDVPERGYRLLLGLRRPRYWSALRPRAFAAAFASLRSAFGAVVCDVDSDVEGEAEGGSLDVEERNVMARTAVRAADAVFVVGRSGMKGTATLVALVAELLDFGVAPSRLVPVVAAAARSPRQRAETAGTVGKLVARLPSGDAVGSPLFLPRRRVDEALRDGTRLPAPLAERCAGAFAAVLQRCGQGEPLAVDHAPERVQPGTFALLGEGEG